MKIAVVCTGAGLINRGFESAAITWVNALRGHPGVTVNFYTGGTVPGSIQLWSLAGRNPLVRLAQRFHLMNDGARLRQRTFFPSLCRALRADPPDYVWLQEWVLADLLQRWIRRRGLAMRVVFCNGAPVDPASCVGFDLLVDLHDAAQAASLAAGAVPGRCRVIPYICSAPRWEGDKLAARTRLGLPVGAHLVLCAAAWNRHHKRIHHLIEESARTKIRNLHLLLCGQPEAETPGLKAMAAKLLPNSVTWLTLPSTDMPMAYAAADQFVLPSLSEGLGSVLIEAAVAGLPILAHRMPAAEFILGKEYAGLIAMDAPGVLAKHLEAQVSASGNPAGREPFARDVANRFGAGRLAAELVDFLGSVR